MDRSGRYLSRRCRTAVCAAMLAAVALPGTAAEVAQAATQANKPGLPVWAGPVGGTRLLIMKPDVEVGLLTAGGVMEPNQVWTEQATQNLLKAVGVAAGARGIATVDGMAPPPVPAALDDAQRNAIVHLQSVVGMEALLHGVGGPAVLPTKKARFDWTLGPEAGALRDGYGADYALFLYARDSFSSTGRVVMTLLIGVPGGQRSGFGSIVDLRTGDIVWIKANVSIAGDLRTEAGALDLIDDLFRSLPGAAVPAPAAGAAGARQAGQR